MLKTILQNLDSFSTNNAFCIKNTDYSYAQLKKHVSGISKSLQEVEIENRVIGVLTYDSIETYACILASIFNDITFVPINPENPVERISQIIKQAGIKRIYGNRDSENIFKCIGKENFFHTKNMLSDDNIRFVERDNKNDAYILFTSGSTGIPKGVPISYTALDSFLDALFGIIPQTTSEDRFLQMFDLTFDLSIMSYLAPLCKGSSCYTIPEGEIKYMYIYELFEEKDISVALMVPSILSYLKPYFEDISLDKMKYSLFCGEAFHEDICLEWMNCVPNAEVYNVYGPTEATIFCTSYQCSRSNKTYNGILSIGKPMKNVGCDIVDNEKSFLQKEEQGELVLSGKQLTFGYLNNEKKNKETFFTINNTVFYKTGDLCYADDDGDFMYCGRIDHQVKIDGYRVELSEIEHHVRDNFDVQNTAAVGFVNHIGNTQLHLFIENFRGDMAAVRNLLKDKLPDYMVPAEITTLNTFPLNVNGKIDRKELKKSLEKR